MNHKLQAIDMQGSKMINRFSNIMCWLVLAAVFVVIGCEQEHKEDAFRPRTGLTDPNFVMPEYASRAIEATGGRQAWRNKKKLELDCVVTLYKPDGSFYLTEQHHEIYSVQGPDFQPPLNSVRISALEPQGKVVCQSSPDKFGVIEGDYRLYSLPIGLRARFFAEMILDITATPARLLDKSVEFSRASEVVKMEGLWYHSIKRISCDVGLVRPYSKSVFYQNRDSSRIDMLWFADVDEGNFFAVRGYDYRKVEKKGVSVPTKIEIFRTDAAGVVRERLVKIDYYLLKATQ